MSKLFIVALETLKMCGRYGDTYCRKLNLLKFISNDTILKGKTGKYFKIMFYILRIEAELIVIRKVMGKINEFAQGNMDLIKL